MNSTVLQFVMLWLLIIKFDYKTVDPIANLATYFTLGNSYVGTALTAPTRGEGRNFVGRFLM